MPEGIDRQDVADWLAAQDGVSDVHDLHIWALSTTRNALAVHLVWHGTDADAFQARIASGLEQVFGIAHVTLQLETAACDRATVCAP